MKLAIRHFWSAIAALISITSARFSPAHAGAFDGLFGTRLDRMPLLKGGTGWVNASPVTRESLHGKVVLLLTSASNGT